MNKTQVKHPHISVSAGVHGGSPVIEKTRIPVSTIIIWYKQGKDVDEILEMYPQLSPAQVYDALSYFHDNQKTIEKEIALLQDDESWQKRYPAGKGSSRR
jgi:uncharacterized protein (DUF433 family)